VPKATSLTPEALTPQQTTPLAATKQRGQKDAPKKTRMANLTGEQYGSGYPRSSFLRKGIKISRSLLQNGT